MFNKEQLSLILYSIDVTIDDLKNRKYEYVNPTHGTRVISSVNDGTREGHLLSQAIHGFTGETVPRNGTRETFEYSKEERNRRNIYNANEFDRMHGDSDMLHSLMALRDFICSELEH